MEYLKDYANQTSDIVQKQDCGYGIKCLNSYNYENRMYKKGALQRTIIDSFNYHTGKSVVSKMLWDFDESID